MYVNNSTYKKTAAEIVLYLYKTRTRNDIKYITKTCLQKMVTDLVCLLSKKFIDVSHTCSML